jgi:hypothetical protein
MISTILPCDKCKKVDITGIDPINNERLCPACYAVKVKVNSKVVRYNMKNLLMQQAETQVPILLTLKSMLDNKVK